MNDTTRDELMERVRVLLRGYLGSIGDCDAASGSVTTMLHIEKGAAADIIALVTAARDAEIREALLSEGAVDAANDAGNYDSGLGVMHHCGFDAVVAALNHIGLDGDGTGGQG